jgi:hypothetical protein
MGYSGWIASLWIPSLSPALFDTTNGQQRDRHGPQETPGRDDDQSAHLAGRWEKAKMQAMIAAARATDAE